MIARTVVASALLVMLFLLVGQTPSLARLGVAAIPDPQKPVASLRMAVDFTVRDFQPRIDRTGPMNWIARNPKESSEVFASSISGGLWRSSDGGTNWTPIRSLQPWSVSGIAYLMDGTPGGAVLVTTREDFRTTSGAGVWRSNDRGASWTQVASVPGECSDVPRAHGIAVSGRNVYVATSCGVLQSPNGRTFNKVSSVVLPAGFPSPSIAEHFYSVEVNSTGDVLLGGEAGLFYRFSPATAPAGSGMFGNNAEFRRAMAVTPSKVRPNFVLALAGPRPGPPMLISQDGGQSWTTVPSSSRSPGGAGGSPFVRIFPSRADSTDLYVYYGDSYALYRAGPFLDGDLSGLATDRSVGWAQVDPIGHPDAHDIDFNSSPRGALNERELLLATDGGLETCSFGSTVDSPPICHESQVLGTGSGLSSIQVMSLRGQIIGTGESAVRRLYFDTWHTDKWVSSDDGARWTRIPGEAALLEMERRVPLSSDAQIVYNYNARPNTLSDDLMTNGVNFMDAPGATSPPIILQKGVFVETVSRAGATSLFAATNVTRTTVTRPEWISVANLEICPPRPCAPLSTTDPPIFAGYLGPGKTNAVVYQPYRRGLAVVSGIVVRAGSVPVLIPSRATYSQMKWSGPSGALDVLHGIGWTPFTGFGKFPVIGADPLFPSHLVIPDIRNRMVMRSLDGGDTWNPITDLSDALTRNASGTSRFGFTINRGGFGTQSLVSSVSFFPEDPNLVVVGTVENGLFFSMDRAVTWQRIPNTEHITNVVALYWRSANSVIVGSFGRGLFEIRMRYTLPRSSLDVICGDCRFLPAGPREASIDSPRIVPVSLQSTSDLKQQNFDEAVLVLDGRINGAEVNQGRLERLWVTTGSNEYRFISANSNSKFVTEERSGFVGFKGLPMAEQLRSQGQVIKGITLSNGMITNLIYGASETPIPVPPPLGSVQLPKDTNPQVKAPYLRIFGPEVVLGTIGVSKSFDLQGHLFRPDMPVELRVDGQSTGSQLRTDANGQFATRIVAASSIGPHEIVARQLSSNGTLQAAIGFSVNNSDEKLETSSTKRESPNEKKETVNEKREDINEKKESPNEKQDPKQTAPSQVKDDKKLVDSMIVPLPIFLNPADLIGRTKMSGGKVQLVSISTGKSPDEKSLEWTGMASGDQLHMSFDLPRQMGLELYAAFLFRPQTGSLLVLVNGQEIGGSLDLNSQPEGVVRLRLGHVEFRPGPNTVTFVFRSAGNNQLARISLLQLGIYK